MTLETALLLSGTLVGVRDDNLYIYPSHETNLIGLLETMYDFVDGECRHCATIVRMRDRFIVFGLCDWHIIIYRTHIDPHVMLKDLGKVPQTATCSEYYLDGKIVHVSGIPARPRWEFEMMTVLGIFEKDPILFECASKSVIDAVCGRWAPSYVEVFSEYIKKATSIIESVRARGGLAALVGRSGHD